MSAPFLGEIRLFSFNFPPKGWAFCDGQTLAIQQNAALFSLLGTFYGGNGTLTFALPNLEGRIAIGQGSEFGVGEVSGEVSHTLLINEMAGHSHSINAAGSPWTDSPAGAFMAQPDVNARLGTLYAPTGNQSGSTAAIHPIGGSQPHENRQPSLVMNYSIALSGIFPSRN